MFGIESYLEKILNVYQYYVKTIQIYIGKYQNSSFKVGCTKFSMFSDNNVIV